MADFDLKLFKSEQWRFAKQALVVVLLVFSAWHEYYYYE